MSCRCLIWCVAEVVQEWVAVWKENCCPPYHTLISKLLHLPSKKRHPSRIVWSRVGWYPTSGQMLCYWCVIAPFNFVGKRQQSFQRNCKWSSQHWRKRIVMFLDARTSISLSEIVSVNESQAEALERNWCKDFLRETWVPDGLVEVCFHKDLEQKRTIWIQSELCVVALPGSFAFRQSGEQKDVST